MHLSDDYDDTSVNGSVCPEPYDDETSTDPVEDGLDFPFT